MEAKPPLHASDASNRQTPSGIVVPKTIAEVVTTVAMARKYGAPILSRGGGASLTGQCCNTAILMDFGGGLLYWNSRR